MTEETPKNQQFDEDHLFKLTMDKKWKEVVDIYVKQPTAHTTKLTKSEETALHIAVSSYHTKPPFNNVIIYIEQMVESIEKNIIGALSMQNRRGNTPLHLAAAVGCLAICNCIASRNHRLIAIRNANGETPLFVAAHHGHLKVFLCLEELYNKNRDEAAHDPETESLCRRKDGNTVLHSAISGEYFKLAYQIISCYQKLVNSVNEEGESPLHVLARMPNVFKSSSHHGIFSSIVYYCVFVAELKQRKYNPDWVRQENRYLPTSEINVPENYRTCMDILLLLWAPISKTISASFSYFKKEDGHPTDKENKQHTEDRPQTCSSYFKSEDGHPTDEENQQHTEDKPQIKDAKKKRKDDAFFPPNYTTCVLLFKSAIAVILTVLGVGFWRIKKIKEKKERHSHALKIMSKLIEAESRYKYDSNGQRPRPKLDHQHSSGIKIPDTPPHNADEHETQIDHTTSLTESQSKKESAKDTPQLFFHFSFGGAVKHTPKLSAKDTPLLVAAKMGIPEMVEKIISTWPIAIQDLDSDEKNVLLLAAENRHTNVLDYLLEINLPEYMFHQLDNEGNSILHLAARLAELRPWRIPGAALQMQWEIKWFEHVKSLVPRLSFAHHNAMGETPRKIFNQTHEDLVKQGNEWLIKTSESCSVVAALIATVAFATSATVPGGLNQTTGYPILYNHTAFDIFAITSLVALCLAVTALVFFLAIITSRGEERDFKTDLPRKLLMGLTSLFTAIAAMLLSFCAGHSFTLKEKLRVAAVPIYAVAIVPVIFFAIAQLPLYWDLLSASCRRVPLRSYKVFYQ